MSEAPDTVHGRLQEAVHIAGYTWKRACDELEWLLEDDRWKQVDGGCDDINAFLGTLDLSQFKLAVEDRRGLARKLKELQASQRATGRALGVDEGTIRGDLGTRTAENSAQRALSPAQSAEAPSTNAENSAPAWFQDDDVDPAKLAEGRTKRKQRDQKAQRQRIADDRQRAKPEDVAAPEIRRGDFREVLADLRDVDAIITDPPYGQDHLNVLADLAAWADVVLRPEGLLAVLFGQTHLPEVYRLLAGHRPYRWTACLLTGGPGYVSHARGVQAGWKPVLIYGGGPRFSDVIRSEGLDLAAKDAHRWGQDFAAFSTIVERLTQSGELVADPFCGSGTTLLAAQTLNRRAIGCDIDGEAIATAKRRLAA